MEFPVEDLDGEVVDVLKGDLVFLVLDVEYQQAIKDWVAVWFGASANQRLGVDEVAVLAQGITLVLTTELGVLVNVHEGEKSYLAVSLHASSNGFTGISPIDFVQKVIEDGLGVGEGSDNDLIRTAETKSGRLGVRYAHALSPLLGLTLLGEGGLLDAFDGSSKSMWALGGALSVDLSRISEVPLGLSVHTRFDSFAERGGDFADEVATFGWSIAYTKQREFNVGIGSNYSRIGQRDGKDPLKFNGFSLNLRYFF